MHIMGVSASIREKLTHEMIKINHLWKFNPIKIYRYTVLSNGGYVYV